MMSKQSQAVCIDSALAKEFRQAIEIFGIPCQLTRFCKTFAFVREEEFSSC